MNIENVLTKGSMILCAVIISIIATVACTDSVESRGVQARDIYLPEMEFETLSDTDNATLQMCRESANIIVYKFALETFLAGQDKVFIGAVETAAEMKNLRTLGQIAFAECLKLYSLKVVELE